MDQERPPPAPERPPDRRRVKRHWLKPPVNVPFEQATPQQVAQALFSAVPPPDPRKRRQRPAG